MRIIATTALLGLLAACGSSEDETTTIPTGDGEMEVKESSKGDQVSFTNEDGETVTITERGGKDAAWPDGFSPYPGATEISDVTMGSDESSTTMINFVSEDTADQIVDFYRKEAEAAGFKIQMDVKADDGRMLTAEVPDERVFSIATQKAADIIEVTLTVGGKD